MKNSILKKLLFILLLSINLVCFGLSSPICSPPDCKVYTITNPTDGIKLSVSDWGAKHPNKPAILFVHGLPHDQFLWLNQINNDSLRNSFRLITMDWRGFGLSDKPELSASYSQTLLAGDINAVINTLNLNKVVLVAHSAGGIPVISYMDVYGTDKVSGLVITDAIVDNGVFPFIPQSVFDLVGQGAFAPTADAFQNFNQQFLTLSTFAPLDPGLNNFLLMHELLMPQAPRQALLGSFPLISLNILHNVSTKTLIVWGENDAVILVGAANYLHNIIPNNELVILKSTGHLPMIETVKAYDKALSDFVGKLAQ